MSFNHVSGIASRSAALPSAGRASWLLVSRWAKTANAKRPRSACTAKQRYWHRGRRSMNRPGGDGAILEEWFDRVCLRRARGHECPAGSIDLTSCAPNETFPACRAGSHHRSRGYRARSWVRYVEHQPVDGLRLICQCVSALARIPLSERQCFF